MSDNLPRLFSNKTPIEARKKYLEFHFQGNLIHLYIFSAILCLQGIQKTGCNWILQLWNKTGINVKMPFSLMKIKQFKDCSVVIFFKTDLKSSFWKLIISDKSKSFALFLYYLHLRRIFWALNLYKKRRGA